MSQLIPLDIGERVKILAGDYMNARGVIVKEQPEFKMVGIQVHSFNSQELHWERVVNVRRIV